MPDPNSEWQQPPPISGGLPVTLQLLSTGAGIGVGCGVGVGFISPLNLSAVPVLGQAASGISAGLGGVSSWLGAAGSSARQAARGLGVPGLDVGAGCGVLAGYYFGAGLMVKPSVVDQVARATTQLAGRLSQTISQKFQHAVPAAAAGSNDGHHEQQQHNTPTHTADTSSGGSSAGASLGAAVPLLGGMLQERGPQQLAASTSAPQFGQQQQQQQQQQHLLPAAAPVASPVSVEDSLARQLILQQQADIAALKKQNRQLRAAVCKIDPKSALCRTGRGPRKKQLKISSDDCWSEH